MSKKLHILSVAENQKLIEALQEQVVTLQADNKDLTAALEAQYHWFSTLRATHHSGTLCMVNVNTVSGRMEQLRKILTPSGERHE